MPWVITSLCQGQCHTHCVEVCCVDCIQGPLSVEQIQEAKASGHTRLERVQLYIDPQRCVDCSTCETVCPVNAIFYVDDVPEQYQQDIARNARFFESFEY